MWRTAPRHKSETAGTLRGCAPRTHPMFSAQGELNGICRGERGENVCGRWRCPRLVTYRVRQGHR